MTELSIRMKIQIGLQLLPGVLFITNTVVVLLLVVGSFDDCYSNQRGHRLFKCAREILRFPAGWQQMSFV